MKKLKLLNKTLLYKNIPFDKLKLLFWVLPVFHFFISVIIHNKLGYFFLNITDPEYFHLLSGAAMSVLRLDPAYIDHPGTPIQITVAIAARLTYLVSNQQGILYDVVRNPETYILAANVLFNIFLLFVMLYIGKKAAKFTNNFWVGILLQLGFFSQFNLIRVTGRLVPEGFMLLPLGLLILLLLRYLYDDDFVKNQKKYLLFFSILMGWGLSTKLSFVPFLIIPFFLLSTLKNKLLYIALTILFFFVFAFPILSHLNQFWDWGSNMFVHSGRWGSGKANFIDFSVMPQRLSALYHYNIPIFILLAILSIENSILFFVKRKNTFYKKYFKVSLASIVSIAFLLFLICKHFAVYYFIPALLFNSFLIFLVLFPFTEIVRNKSITKYLYFSGMLLAFVFMIFSMNRFSHKSFISMQKQQLRLCTFRKQIKPGNLLIISGFYAGTPFKEFALANGILLSGPAKKLFYKPLKKFYPNTYIYYDWSDKFFHWDTNADTKTLINKHRPVFIYIGKSKQKDLTTIIDRFQDENPNYEFNTLAIIDNNNFKDKLYKLVISKKHKSSPKTLPNSHTYN